MRKFFGYKEETPCEKCDGPRVGIDCDDDYYVVAGRLEGLLPTCDAKPIPYTYGNEAYRAALTPCPRGGGKRFFAFAPKYGSGSLVFCVNAETPPGRKLVRLPGCPHCRVEAHNYFGLSD